MKNYISQSFTFSSILIYTLLSSCSDKESPAVNEPEIPDYTLGSLEPGGVYMVERLDTIELNSKKLIIKSDETEKMLTLLTYGIKSNELKTETSGNISITLTDPADGTPLPKKIKWLPADPEEFHSEPVYEQHILIRKETNGVVGPSKATVRITRQPERAATCWFTTFTVEG